MNYEKQLCAFYSTLDYKRVSAFAIAMYLILLNIAKITGWLSEFRVANSVFMSKIVNLSISTLQRARKELIDNDYIIYKKGKNQNDASKYSIVKLYNEQADEQAHEQADEQPNEQAVEHIIIKINNFFNYISNNEGDEFENIAIADKTHLVAILKRLEFYVPKNELHYIQNSKSLEDFKILCYAIKEIYFSSNRAYLDKATRNRVLQIYHNTNKYVAVKANYTVLDVLNYFIKSLEYEAEEVLRNEK
ncbi:MAG: hypothetical protein HFJ52_04190 [Clostridia bacterium]|jgi:hypothetical protein|nr:hypothetical protein [Clostridia bacterium]